jgi:hypothetical protein
MVALGNKPGISASAARVSALDHRGGQLLQDKGGISLISSTQPMLPIATEHLNTHILFI